MKKTLPFFSMLCVLFLLSSCVPPDPAMVYGWNTNTPGSTITGPRILHKIDSANVTVTEYVSTSAGVLQQVKYHATSNEMDVLYNSDNKVNQMVLQDGTVILDLSLNYDTAGKVTSAVMVQTQNNVNMGETHFTLSYNPAGKVIKLDKKVKNPVFSNNFTHYGVVSLVWSGDNVVKATENTTGIIHADGTLEPLDPNGNITYKFEEYDSKINPYSTLPKEFNLGMGMMGTVAFAQCSFNNHLKMQLEPFFNIPPIVTTGSFVYDTSNYPVSDQQDVFKFIYKGIQ